MTPWTPKVARQVAEVLRALWFVPALMALAGVALGLVMPRVDAIPDVLATIRFGWLRNVLDSARRGPRRIRRIPPPGGAAGSREHTKGRPVARYPLVLDAVTMPSAVALRIQG